MKMFSSSIGPREFITLMAMLMSIVAISIDAMVPALGVIGAEFALQNPNQAQFIIGFIFFGMAIGQLVCGPLSDAIGRRPVLFYTILIYLAGSVICYVSDNLTTMLIGRFLQGLGVAGPYITSVSVVRDKFHGRQMARIMSLVMMIFIMVPALAPSLGQSILFFASWRAIFALYVIYAVVIIFWAFLRLDETLPHQKRVPINLANITQGVKKVVQTRSTFCYTLCMGFIFGGLMSYLNSCQQIFQGLYNTGPAFALYFGGLALMFGASSLVNAKLVEKRGMRPLCKQALIINMSASLVFLALHLIAAPPLWLFVLYLAVIFFNLGMLFGNLNALAMEPMGQIAGLASAIIGALSSLISLTVGTWIGQMYNETLIPLALGFLVLSSLSYAAFMLAHTKAERVAERG